MRMYIVRFWKRMLKLGRLPEEIDLLLETGIISQEEYDAILES